MPCRNRRLLFPVITTYPPITSLTAFFVPTRHRRRCWCRLRLILPFLLMLALLVNASATPLIQQTGAYFAALEPVLNADDFKLDDEKPIEKLLPALRGAHQQQIGSRYFKRRDY